MSTPARNMADAAIMPNLPWVRGGGLRGEIGSMKDRLPVVERIVTDESQALHHEIERPRGSAN